MYLAKTLEGSKTILPDIGGLEWDHVLCALAPCPSRWHMLHPCKLTSTIGHCVINPPPLTLPLPMDHDGSRVAHYSHHRR